MIGITSKRKHADDHSLGPPDKLSKRRLIDYKSTVPIVVGEEQQLVTVPLALLDTSEYFQAALQWRKDNEQLTLRDVHVPTFTNYLSWSTRACDGLIGRNVEAAIYEFSRKVTFEAYHDRWCRSWILGDYLADSVYCDVMIARLTSQRSRDQSIPSQAAVEYVWENTSKDCELRELLLSFSTAMNPDKLKAKDYPEDFVQELCIRLLDKTTAFWNWEDSGR